jgi:hypothetical protein
MMSGTSTTMGNRILDLMLPFRDECFDASITQEDREHLEKSAKLERKTLSLARKQDTTEVVGNTNTFFGGNLAFVVQNHRFKTEKNRRTKIEDTPKVNPEDVCIVIRG